MISHKVLFGCLFFQLTLTGAFQSTASSFATRSSRIISSYYYSSLAATSSDYDYYNEDEEAGAGRGPGGKRKRVRPIRVSNPTAKQAELNRKEAQARHGQALQDPTLLSNVLFQEREDIHPTTKRAITEVLGLQAMTEVQSKTYAEALRGGSVLARSRTGTGKTLAFLIPSLERILINDQRLYHPGRNVGVLIVAPSRELTQQVSETTKELLTFHNKENDNLSVLCLYGGSKIAKDIGLLNQQIPAILICTPGRLQDHLEGTRLRGRKFSDIVAETSILVIDEMDLALQSFPREMKKILSFLPRSAKRQTLLFSATVPKRLTPVFQSVLPEDYAVIDCVSSSTTTHDKSNNKNSKRTKRETNARVQQSYVMLKSMDNFVEAMVAIVSYYFDPAVQQQQKHKLMVFFPTARLVKFFAELFNVVVGGILQIRGVRTFQMHSKMSQSARNRVREAFRVAKTGVLFTTDVSARGLDYPEVSTVIQFGYPKTWEGYVHRLGRTGRAGYDGQGLLVLLPFEEDGLKTVRRRGLSRNEKIDSVIESLPNNKKVNAVLETAGSLIGGNSDRVLTPAAETAYLSLLAYYGARADSLGLSGDEVLHLATSFAKATGLRTENLELSPSLLKDLKLSKTPGE